MEIQVLIEVPSTRKLFNIFVYCNFIEVRLMVFSPSSVEHLDSIDRSLGHRV